MTHDIRHSSRILDAGVIQMNHLPDFGRVEGRVLLMIKRQPVAPVEKATIMTSVDARRGESLADLRQRLAQDAVRLWAMTETMAQREPYDLPHAA